MSDRDLIHEVERLQLRDGEVLVVRPRRSLFSHEIEMLHGNLAKLARNMGWGPDRILILDRDVEMTVVSAEQQELLPDVAGVAKGGRLG